MKLPAGYKYASIYAGIRKDRRDDLALIVSSPPASAAAVFTTNRVQAAPVKLAREHLRTSKGRVSGVLINAGNANCATRTGARVALTCARAAAKHLKAPITEIIPASTGVIGVELNAQRIVDAMPALVAGLSESRFPDVARAIMTTDLVPKTAFLEVPLKYRAGKPSSLWIAGMTKGSGMIHPLLATTLGFVMTDAGVSAHALKPVLKRAVERSYNRLSVDGDTSTNDIVLLMANGASGVELEAKELKVFEERLTALLCDLAAQIARDGEGASKLVTIRVCGAPDENAAARIARAIANSPLVKTAVGGADPNWGRVLSAAGNAGVDFDPSKVDIAMQGMRVCHAGLAAHFPESDLAAKLHDKDVQIDFMIRGKGKGEARFFTCDFTEGYIRINGSYRT